MGSGDIVFLAAFPHETKRLRKSISPLKKSAAGPFTVYATDGPRRTAVVQTGMGAANARAAFRRCLGDGKPGLLVSVGFCGALYPKARVGELIWATRFLCLPDGDTLEVSGPPGLFEKLSGLLPLARGEVATFREWQPKKGMLAALPPGLSRPVCDMETFFLAREAKERGIPFISVRAVSDTLERDLPLKPRDAVNRNGMYSLARAMRFLLMNPRRIPAIMRLGISSRKAARSLAVFGEALREAL
ncbi:MAG: hypothetical protein P8Y39_11465 [Nitrospirota bacterium]